ncbi:hypothetical protein CEP52_015260 [Fusarium oligoseptatum]|uniref:Protein kinase domain-containing protein n=1 Tax=Fusarium oligoseptatum TaxID=2604345 RepID=A0A428SEV2_9HYPO|nr:hypothetical protein CEP52_015260 [Fusarium oligoseptatum]
MKSGPASAFGHGEMDVAETALKLVPSLRVFEVGFMIQEGHGQTDAHIAEFKTLSPKVLCFSGLLDDGTEGLDQRRCILENGWSNKSPMSLVEPCLSRSPTRGPLKMAITDFFLWRVSTPTVSRQVLKCLVSSLEAARDGEDIRDKFQHVLVLRLVPFERRLLTSILELVTPDVRAAAMTPSVPLDVLATHMFFKWSWTSAVLRQIHVEFESDVLQNMHGGKQTAAFDMVKEMLRSRHTRVASDRRYYRTEQLVQDNQDFISQLGEINADHINVAPHAEDLVLWRMVALLLVRNLDLMREWKGFRTIVGLYSRSKSLQQGLGSQYELATESDDLLNPLLATTFAETLYQELGVHQAVFNSDPSAFPEVDGNPQLGELVRSAKSTLAVDLMTETVDVWDVWIFERLFRLHLSGTQHPPLNFPTEDFLVCQDLDMNLFNSINLKRSSNLLYVNEDLYCRHIQEDYDYPGYFLNGGVLVRCRDLNKTPFAEEMKEFWTDWNDVAVTRDQDTSQFLLVETLPGIKARQLKRTSSDSGPIVYFDFKWRHRLELDTQRRDLKALLGEHFKPSYCDFLLYIDASELDLSNARFIGEGSFGRVHCVSWKKKPIEVSLDHVEEQVGQVAIKVSHARLNKDFESDAKFFAELATSYQALSGNGNLAGFVRLFGITKVLVDPDTGHMYDPQIGNASGYQTRLALVFDYASGGNMIDFLANELMQDDFYEVWGNLCTYFADIARALKDIHSRGIMHRDLHQGNVLVQTEVKPDDIESYVLISDLGEGKALDPNSASEYAAPEISDGTYTASSDIFAWAQLCIEAIRVSHNRLVWEDGQVRYPKRLMIILETCLSAEPEERLSAAKLADMIQDVSLEMIREEKASGVEWFLGSYKLPIVAKRLSTSLELSDAWFKSS